MRKTIIGLSAFICVSIFASFTSKNDNFKKTKTSKEAYCFMFCEWNPTTSNLALASISDCCADDYQTNVTSSGFSGVIDHTGGSVEITTDVGTSHPAGTIVIKHNGTTVHTHPLAANENVVCTQFYTPSCHDVFTVEW